MTIKYTKNIQSKAPKIYPNWDFWFENKPSGNPALFLEGLKKKLDSRPSSGNKLHFIRFKRKKDIQNNGWQNSGKKSDENSSRNCDL
jgi:hypothetical protein